LVVRGLAFVVVGGLGVRRPASSGEDGQRPQARQPTDSVKQHTGVDGPGHDRVERDLGEDRDAEDVGHVSRSERPAGLGDQDDPVRLPGRLQGGPERQVARTAEHEPPERDGLVLRAERRLVGPSTIDDGQAVPRIPSGTGQRVASGQREAGGELERHVLLA